MTGEVQVVDLAQGEQIPADIFTALTDETVIKMGIQRELRADMLIPLS